MMMILSRLPSDDNIIRRCIIESFAIWQVTYKCELSSVNQQITIELQRESVHAHRLEITTQHTIIV